jgi:hypothetical protein
MLEIFLSVIGERIVDDGLHLLGVGDMYGVILPVELHAITTSEYVSAVLDYSTVMTPSWRPYLSLGDERADLFVSGGTAPSRAMSSLHDTGCVFPGSPERRRRRPSRCFFLTIGLAPAESFLMPSLLMAWAGGWRCGAVAGGRAFVLEATS